MGRLIVIGLIVLLVVWLLKRALAGPKAAPKSDVPPQGADGKGDLVACAHCGVNLPKSDARSAGGHYFCSEEHWRAGPRQG